MRIKPFTLFITCLFATLFMLTACDTLPTGQNNVPAPVEQYGVNTNTDKSLSITNPTKVAILLPLSGANATLGQSMLQAAQLALFDMGNSNFELIPIDTKGTETGGQEAAEKAINGDAQIILGPLFSDAVRGAKKFAIPNDIKIIAFSTDWSLAGPSTFVMGFMPFSQVNRIAEYAIANGLKRHAIIAPRDKYGDVVSSRFEKNIENNGGKIIHKINYLANDMASTNKIKEINPNIIDAVFIPAGGEDLEKISAILTMQGMPPSKIKRLGTGLWDSNRVAALTDLQGGWFAGPSPRSRQNFERQYQSTYGQNPIRVNTLAYDATALAAVLANKGYSRATITDPNGFIGIDGVFRFGGDGIVERGLAVLELRKGQIIEIAPAPKRF